jgi:hypothetical protein
MSLNSKPYGIYCLQKNGELLQQADVTESDGTTIMELKPLPAAIHHMDSYIKELFELMLEYDNLWCHEMKFPYKTKRYNYLNGEYLEGTIFGRWYMRKGTYYYVCQNSDRGTRFLLYAINRSHHSSVAFGFGMRIPNIDEQRNEMQLAIREIPDLADSTLINSTNLYFL